MSEKNKKGCASGCAKIILVGFIAFVALGLIFNIMDKATEKADEADRAERVERVERAQTQWKMNGEEVLASMGLALKQRDYQKALSLAKPYSLVSDSNLAELLSKARNIKRESEEQARQAQIEKLVSEIKIAEGEEKVTKLDELLAMDPNTREFAEDIAHIREKREKLKLEEARKKRIREQQEARQDRIDSNFSAWDGSHRPLTRLVKGSMNDPKSYKHVETVFWDKGDHLVVLTTFRGKNAFGAVVKNWIKAKTDLDGKVLEVIDQGP
jgi:hypothetical protein